MNSDQHNESPQQSASLWLSPQCPRDPLGVSRGCSNRLLRLKRKRLGMPQMIERWFTPLKCYKVFTKPTETDRNEICKTLSQVKGSVSSRITELVEAELTRFQ